MKRNITQGDIDDKGCSAAALDDAAYGRDFVMWLAKQTTLLRAGQFEALDLANLVEELESLERREHREQERLASLHVDRHAFACTSLTFNAGKPLHDGHGAEIHGG